MVVCLVCFFFKGSGSLWQSAKKIALRGYKKDLTDSFRSAICNLLVWETASVVNLDGVFCSYKVSRMPSGQSMYLTDVLEVLDIDSFCVHNFLYNIGSHLVLVFSYFLAMLAYICILFFILDTITTFWHFLLINSQLQPEQTKQVRVANLYKMW